MGRKVDSLKKRVSHPKQDGTWVDFPSPTPRQEDVLIAYEKKAKPSLGEPKKIRLEVTDMNDVCVFTCTMETKHACIKHYNTYLKSMNLAGHGYKKTFWYTF